MSAERNVLPRPTLKELLASVEQLPQYPPALILVFDNYRGLSPEEKTLADRTMMVRSAVAAKIYHSHIYKIGEKPAICCFAGKHFADWEAGSTAVKQSLITYGVRDDEIVTRTNTITTISDYQQLHSYIAAYVPGPIAIVSTDDHLPRAAQEWLNHFTRGGHKNIEMPPAYFIGPSSPVLDCLKIVGVSNLNKAIDIEQGINVGKSNSLTHGLGEKAAFFVSKLPQTVRETLQPILSRRNHPYTPEKLARIQRRAQLIIKNTRH